MPTSADIDTLSLPDILSGVAQGSRYRCFKGRSGQRYIFTKMSAMDLEDCRQAVVLLFAKGRASGGRQRPDEPVLLGEIDRYGKWHGPRLGKSKFARHEIYVHLLAEDASRRQSIVSDLAVTGHSHRL